MNAPERNIHDAADGALRQDAIDNLTDRLKTGGAVGRVDLRDILSDDVDQGRVTAEDLYQILTNYDDRHLLAERMVDQIISRFIATNPDAVEEEAAQIEHDRGVEA